MRRRHGAAALLPLLAIVAPGGCGDSPAGQRLAGELYYGSGSYLGRFDLRDASGSVVADLGEVNIRSVDALDDGRLLLSVEGPIHNRMVSRILRFDPATRDSRPLFGGRAARFVPGSGHIVFERDAKLIAAGIGPNAGSERRIASLPRGASPTVVPLSQDRFIYSIGASPALRARLHDLRSGEETALDALPRHCELSDALWLPGRDELLCRAPGAEPATLQRVTLEGTIAAHVALPKAAGVRLLAYRPGPDVAVVTTTSLRWLSGTQRTSVWALKLASGQAVELSDDHYLGASAAWVDGR